MLKKDSCHFANTSWCLVIINWIDSVRWILVLGLSTYLHQCYMVSETDEMCEYEHQSECVCLCVLVCMCIVCVCVCVCVCIVCVCVSHRLVLVLYLCGQSV